MADYDKIRYSDLIEPDNSIKDLIKQLESLGKSYEDMINAIKAGADKIVVSVKSASGATSEGRKTIEDAASATSRLKRAQDELKLALSDTGKQIAWLKAQTSDANKATVEQQRYLQQAVSSYDRLRSDLKQTVELYKSLSAAERADSQTGQQLLSDIINLKAQIKALDDQMKPHIQTLSEVQKAEQRLAFLQSDEGKRLIELKAKIAELTSSRRSQSTTTDALAAAQQKLAAAQSAENQQLRAYSLQISQANKIAQLQAQIATSAEGSYNKLSAQYSLNKIKLNQMSESEREAADSGKKLEEETNAIYQKMIKLQEATGNYRLSVGHYQRAWDGLNVSISQAVQELPSAALSLNTFFLGISNNIPMVIDAIKELKAQNEAARANGEKTVNITKKVVSALFNWNTALVIVLTVLSMYGQQIADWISNVFKGRAAAISMTEALDNVAKELENTNGSYGSNMVKLQQLQQEFKNLKTVAEKDQWIKNNKSNFDQLGVSISGVSDAENVFINNTSAVVNALKLRAQAAAAQKLAADQYQKYLVALNKYETESNKISKQGPTALDKAKSYILQGGLASTGGSAAQASTVRRMVKSTPEAIARERVKALKDEANAARKTGDAYFNLATNYEKAAAAGLRAAGIKGSGSTTSIKTGGKGKSGGSGREPRDLTNIINKNDIAIQRQYEESITKLQNDEYAKRRKAAADQVADANNKLREMYRKNEEYVKNVGGKYKQLTEDQKKQISDQQNLINKTIANNLKALDLEIQRIKREQQVNSIKIGRNALNNPDIGQAKIAAANQQTLTTPNVSITRDASAMEASLVEERRLMEEGLDQEYQLTLETNNKLREAGDDQARSEEEIIIEFNKKRLELYSEYDKKILDARETDIENQLGLVKKGSDKELQLLLEQNENRRKLALAENAAKPAEQQVSTATINAQYDKSATQIKGNFELTGLEQQQALDKAVFNEVERSQDEIKRFELEQEKALWLKKISLAESGALDWSQVQIDAAKATVKGIDREISDMNSFVGKIADKGLGGALLSSLGFDDKQIEALSEAANVIVDNLQSIAEAEVEAAQQAVEAYNDKVDAAQKAYDAEVEARNNGYANNVATAKKELEQEKKKQQEKQKLLEAAQKRQDALDTISQATSLTTASALLWKSFAGTGPAAPFLAAAAIAAMWTSFAVAKIKARQVTASSDQYGEGGLEFLEGGSHASGHDIDLGVSNKRKRRMRAEGGEALAIINKKRTRKYRKVLPDVINSLNKGTFENKYLKAFAASDGVSISVNNNENVDLSRIESDIREIKKQNETRYYNMPDGSVMMQRRNVKRIIKN